MSLIIRKGAAEDLDAVEKLYGEVCGHMAATVNYCGWKRDVYPARQDAEAGIREGTLFLVEEDGEAAGSFILSPRQEAAYAGVKWQADLEERDVRDHLYIHRKPPAARARRGTGNARLRGPLCGGAGRQGAAAGRIRGEPPGHTAV